MSITLELDTRYAFELSAPVDVVFDGLSDIPWASSLHPTHARTLDLGDGVYQWEMKRYGTEKIHIQTIYACRYTADKASGLIRWTPVAEIGNAKVEGFFKLTPSGEMTHVEVQITSMATLPVPALMKGLAMKMVAAENRKLNEKYINNLIEHFGGGRMLRFG